MQRALELAERGRYSVSPNPMVGCVVVKDGEIIGEGFHQRAGMAHAEVEALRSCKVSPIGSTAYTTLEPCNHTGRTPPCTEVLIAAGVQRVLVAVQDPHVLVDGRGVARLKASGVEVSVGLLEAQARSLNEKFLFAAQHRRPFLLLKAAMTLDGKLATIARQSQWITSARARERSLALREEYDAILVGSGTVSTDDPQLTRRLGWSSSITPWTRVILDARGEVSDRARVLADGNRTLLITSRQDFRSPSENIEVIPMEAENEKFDIARVLTLLGERGIQSVIAEGGSLLVSDVIRHKLWQKMVVFVAPMVVGGRDAPAMFQDNGVSRLDEAFRFRFDSVERLGEDLMIVAYPN